MEKEELEGLISTTKEVVDVVRDLRRKSCIMVYNIEPEDHRAVKNLSYCAWRDIEVVTGVYDDKNNMTYRIEKKDVHYIPSNTQKQIAEWVFRMALSGGVEIEADVRVGNATDKIMLAMLKKNMGR